MRRLIVVLAGIGTAVASLVMPTSAAAAPRAAGQVDLTSTLTQPCTFVAQVNYAEKNAPTLEVYVTQTYTGPPLVPVFVPVGKNSAGTVTVTLPPLAPSSTASNFYVWAQLLDKNGVPVGGIGYGLDFASVSTAYCTAP